MDKKNEVKREVKNTIIQFLKKDIKRWVTPHSFITTFGISMCGEGHVLHRHFDLCNLSLLKLYLLLTVQDLVTCGKVIWRSLIKAE
jgi:hypothetical protein